MKQEFGRFGARVQFSWTNDLSFDEIKERSRTMPPRSAIFYALLSVDGKGDPQVDADTLPSVHAVANAPMFALYGVGDGIGGVVEAISVKPGPPPTVIERPPKLATPFTTGTVVTPLNTPLPGLFPMVRVTEPL